MIGYAFFFILLKETSYILFNETLTHPKKCCRGEPKVKGKKFLGMFPSPLQLYFLHLCTYYGNQDKQKYVWK